MQPKNQIEPIAIDGTLVGPGQPCFIIAEIAQAHDGSLGAAHAYIDVVARSGASAIKFQTHFAAEESTIHEPWRTKFSRQDESRFAYWQRMEFTPEQWHGLAIHCQDKGLCFLSSPFSTKAVELLSNVGMPAWKVASGEVSNHSLLVDMAKTKKPVLLSSGMSDWAELDAAIEVVRTAGAPVALFQTTTAYPCPPEKLGLNVLKEMSARYQVPVGLSDHSATTFAGLAAVAHGANMLEVHLAFSQDCFGPDTTSSLTPSELETLVTGVRFIEKALAHPIDKQEMANELGDLRRIFGKSVVASHAIDSGTVLTADHVALKKPGTGISASRVDEVVGRTLKVDVARDHLIMEEDLV